MKPRGQIHPQKTRPKIIAAIIIMVGGTIDENGILVPVSIVLTIRVGSIFHKRFGREEGRVIP
jgi:hypothetical protein